MNAVIIIPARWESSRFPGKPLADILGKSLIQRVWENCIETGIKTYVATDDERIAEYCKGHYMDCIMTGDCLTGTDRVAEAYKKINKYYDTIINVQGDEPLVSPSDIKFVAESHCVFTVCGMCEATEEEFNNPNIVKVAADRGSLLYMSRVGIPTNKKLEFKGAYKQVCVYAFSPEELVSTYTNKERKPLEKLEDIELLRIMEGWGTIEMVELPTLRIAVNIPSDIKKVEDVLRNG